MTEIDIHTHTALSDAEAVVRRADGGLDDATKPATGFTRQLNAGVAERLGIDLDDATNSEYEVARAHLVRPADTLTGVECAQVRFPEGSASSRDGESEPVGTCEV